MQCPACQSEILDHYRYCPVCGRALEITAAFNRIQSELHVQENKGQVIGIQTGVIKGDVYAMGDFYQVQVFALGAAAGPINRYAFFNLASPPYPFLKPFTAQQTHLFKGRDQETRSALQLISEQRLLTIYGRQGMGKTSLLAAGLIPELAETGALVVYLRSYETSLVKQVRDGLQPALDLPPALGEAGSLHDLLSALKTQLQGTLILVLDQLEQVWQEDYPARQRQELFAGLARSLDELGALYLRIVFGVDQDFIDRLGEQQALLPDVLDNCLRVPALAYNQAADAILKPVKPFDGAGERYRYPVSYYPESFVKEQLVPELDEISSDSPGEVYPPHLQIVCDQLYQAAAAQPSPHLIDESLYRERLGSADTILARYLGQKIELLPAAQRKTIEHCLRETTRPAASRWFLPAAVPTNGVSAEQVTQGLSALVEMGVLERRYGGGQFLFSYTSQQVVQAVRVQLLGREAAGDLQTGDELEYLYNAWLNDRELPTSGQVARLREKLGDRQLHATRALFLLRASLANDQPAGLWVQALSRSALCLSLLQALEFPGAKIGAAAGAGSPTNPPQSMHLEKAKRLVGLADLQPPEQAGSEDSGCGPLACAAVLGKNPPERQAAALALALLPHQQGLDRLDNALESQTRGLKRALRTVGAHGILAENLPAESLPASRDRLRRRFWLRLGIGAWRAGRRIRRRWSIISGGALGGAIVSGLLLGLFRALEYRLSPKSTFEPGTVFLLDGYWGMWFGGAAAFGILLAGSLLDGETPAAGQERPRPGFTRLLAGAALVMLFYGAVHAGLSWIGNTSILRDRPLIIPLGFLAGAGLALGAWGAGARRGAGGFARLAALAGAGLVFALVQLIFQTFPGSGNGLFNSLGPGWFEDYYSYRAAGWWAEVIRRTPGWSNTLAVFDTFLVGVLLALGVRWGMRLARYWLEAWKKYLADWIG